MDDADSHGFRPAWLSACLLAPVLFDLRREREGDRLDAGHLKLDSALGATGGRGGDDGLARAHGFGLLGLLTCEGCDLATRATHAGRGNKAGPPGSPAGPLR